MTSDWHLAELPGGVAGHRRVVQPRALTPVAAAACTPWNLALLPLDVGVGCSVADMGPLRRESHQLT